MGHSFGGLITQMLLEPRAGPGRRRHPPRRAARGLPAAAVGVAGHVSAASQSANRHRAVPLSPPSSTTRSPTRCRGPIRSPATPNLRSPLLGRPLFESALANFTPKSKAATVRRLRQARPGAAATDRRRPRPHHAVLGGLRELHPLPAVAGADGLQAVRGPAASDGGVGRLEDVADYALTWTAGRTG